MKKWYRLLIAAAVFACLFAGCSKKKKTASSDGDVKESTQTEVTTAKKSKESKMCTVTFYDSDAVTVLSTDEVNEGEHVKEYTPEKENAKFVGWYAEKTFASTYDFTKAITKDVSVYAGFITDQEDTRQFIIVGTGKCALLSASNWGAYVNENSYMTKEEGANCYSLTCDLYEGDQFMFVANAKLEDQRGASYLKQTSIDGVHYMDGEGDKTIITCQKDGSYTFTLTTNPSADQYEETNDAYSEETKEIYNYNPFDTLEFTYNGELAGSGKPKTDYYIKGDKITGGQDRYEIEYHLNESDGDAVLVIELEKGDEFLFTSLISDGKESKAGKNEIKYSDIKDEDSLKLVSKGSSGKIAAKEAGIYTFTYNLETKALSIAFIR